ncbi:hypothetical protein SISSUDRAFT_1131295 [Sistotremastrum suecicum HHB10207 ss-3]|uniref:Uncharacterized protein n=1 Tax=Sistotremastrum suecicum HHB10207 ss-3 TaxID=1314776 RepID=A0A166ABN1_9AGAM|nr:hypothetical protein SISSUDRAFT_1131295 [Sistotremastrum suecicum HHB10207 ss-3]
MRRRYACAYKSAPRTSFGQDINTTLSKVSIPADLTADDGVDDQDTYERIANPCDLKNIKAELSAALESQPSGDKAAQTQKSFSFCTPLPHAPTPGLKIVGIGSIPLPLTENGAKELIKVCAPANTVAGKKTSSAKSAGGTWELAASKVSFENPHWNAWLQSTVIPNITKTLDIASISGCQLTKLYIYEKGSRFVPPPSSSTSKSVFASLAILLPSKFEGGLLRMSYGGRARSVDLAKESAFSTSIIASYLDVKREVNAITRGYQLALYFDVIGPPGVQRPGLSGNSNSMAAARHILLSWKQSFDASVPQKLAYVLDNDYDEFDVVTPERLKGFDAYIVHQLRILAKECRFEVYLANATLHVSRPANDLLYQMGLYDDDDDMEDARLDIGGIIDLDGKAPTFPQYSLKFNHPEDFFPEGVDADEPVDEDYDGYSSAFGHSSTQTFKRAVVLLWPKNRHEAVLGKDWLAGATAKLKTLSSATPTSRDKKLVQRMVFHLEGGAKSDTACHEICLAACRWKDFNTWLKSATIATAASEPVVLGHQELVNAALTFGFDKLRDMLTSTLAKSTSNARRDELLSSISESALANETKVKAWCQEQRDVATKDLKSATLDDAKALVSIARSKGIKFFQETIIPQLFSLECDRTVWTAILSALKAERAAIAPSPKAVDDVIKITMTSILEKIDPFALKPAPAHLYDNSPTYDPKPAIEAIRLCATLNSLESCGPIFDKLKKLDDVEEKIRKARSLQICRPVLEAIASMGDLPTSFAFNTPAFIGFAKAAVADIIDHGVKETSYAEWKRIIRGVMTLKFEGIVLLATKLKTLLNVAGSEPSSVLPSTIAKALKEHWTHSPKTEEGIIVQKLIKTLLGVSILRADIMYDALKLKSLWFIPRWLRTAEDLLELCFSTESPSAVANLLSRLQSPTTDINAHLTYVAVPFIATLVRKLASQDIKIDSAPYPSFCQGVLVAFVDKVLGPRPVAIYKAATLRDELTVIGCGCHVCNDMIVQVAGNLPVVVIKRAEKERKHLEQRIKAQLGLVCRTIKSGSPHGLEITKPPSLVEFGAWSIRRKVATDALDAIGSSEVQQAVLGASYTRIITRLGLPCASSAKAVEPKSVQPKSNPPPPTVPSTAQANSTTIPPTQVSSVPPPPKTTASTCTKRSMPSSLVSVEVVPRKRSKTASTSTIHIS